MAPTKEQIEAAIEALRTDASMWAEMADEINGAGQVADRLDLDALHFSYLGDKVGLTETYHDIQDLLVRLMQEGAAQFQALAVALRTAADGYEQDEANAVHRMRNIY